MELLVGALQKAAGTEAAPFVLAEKRDVNAREPVALRQLCGAGREHALASFAGGSGPYQQPPPRHGREGDGDLQLGIVITPCLHEGFRPAVIEHVLALAVGFQIARRAAGDLAAKPEHEMARGPAGAAADRPSVLEGFQEGMRNERIVGGGVGIGAGVPGLRRDVGDTRHDLDFCGTRSAHLTQTLSADLDMFAKTTGSQQRCPGNGAHAAAVGAACAARDTVRNRRSGNSTPHNLRRSVRRPSARPPRAAWAFSRSK